jgi:hypothetical protein
VAEPDLKAEIGASAAGSVLARATAIVYRLQAATLRQRAQTDAAQADALERAADRVERGEDGPPPEGQTLRLVVGMEQDDEEARPPTITPLRASKPGADGEDPVFVVIDGRPMDGEMAAWVDTFDPRFSHSPFFVQAVNDAAAQSLVLSESAGRWVAGRVQELEARAQAIAGGDDGGTEPEDPRSVPEWNGETDGQLRRCPVSGCQVVVGGREMKGHIAAAHPAKAGVGD